MKSAPQWVKELPAQALAWLMPLMSTKQFGLFRDCAGEEAPHLITASSVALGLFRKYGSLSDLPGYSDQAIPSLVEYLQGCQDPRTGLFADPELEDRMDKRNERDYINARRAISKYAIGFLEGLGASPSYPYSETGMAGKPDLDEYRSCYRDGNWSKPWGVGSHSAGKTRELFSLINEGHEEYIPAVCEGVEFILGKQNPATGMWGDDLLPLHQQIGGALKVIGRFLFWMGMEIPNIERLADSCIEHHADRSFYADLDDICVPRNVAEICVACLEHSDYRRDELLATMGSLAEQMLEFRMPDGAFATDTVGTGPHYSGGVLTCQATEIGRGTISGTHCVMYALGIMSPYIWDNSPLAMPHEGWRERVAAMPYRIVRSSNGKYEVVKA